LEAVKTAEKNLPRIIGKGVVGTMEHEELLAQNAIDGHDLKAWSGGAP
jgi:nicotinic acid phosphoribosyltransferase